MANALLLPLQPLTSCCYNSFLTLSGRGKVFFIKDDSSQVVLVLLVGVLVAPVCLQTKNPERPALRNFITLSYHSQVITIFRDILTTNTAMLNILC